MKLKDAKPGNILLSKGVGYFVVEGPFNPENNTGLVITHLIDTGHQPCCITFYKSEDEDFEFLADSIEDFGHIRWEEGYDERKDEEDAKEDF